MERDPACVRVRVGDRRLRGGRVSARVSERAVCVVRGVPVCVCGVCGARGVGVGARAWCYCLCGSVSAAGSVSGCAWEWVRLAGGSGRRGSGGRGRISAPGTGGAQSATGAHPCPGAPEPRSPGAGAARESSPRPPRLTGTPPRRSPAQASVSPAPEQGWLRGRRVWVGGWRAPEEAPRRRAAGTPGARGGKCEPLGTARGQVGWSGQGQGAVAARGGARGKPRRASRPVSPRRRQEPPFMLTLPRSPLRRSRRDPRLRPAPAPCTARWPRRTPTGGRRRPRAPAAGPQASARTWPSGLPWAVAAAGMGTLVSCCPGCRRPRFEPTTSSGPGAPGTTAHPRPPWGRVSAALPTRGPEPAACAGILPRARELGGTSRRSPCSLQLFGISWSS